MQARVARFLRRGALAFLLACAPPRLPAQSAPQTALYGQAFLRSWTAPEYPPQALKAREGGRVQVRLVVDENGNVAAARAVDSTADVFTEPALRAARTWKFTPALEAGKPAKRSMDAAVDFSPDNPSGRPKVGSLPAQDEMPVLSPTTDAQLASSPNIEYPDSLFDRKLSGRAHYFCRVLADGTAVKPRIVAATHVDFVLPALKTIMALKYTPRMQGDMPIESDAEGDLRFDLTRGSAAGVLEANGITGADGAPPAAEIEPLEVVDPIVPYERLLKGEGGHATVLFTVDKDGAVSGLSVVEASAPDFGAALDAAVEMSSFQAPGLDGKSVAVSLKRTFEFPAAATEAGTPQADLLAALRTGKIGTGLDGPLKPVYTASPQYPAALKAAGKPAGDALIEFVVDEEGRARLPRVISASDPAFGWSAATAVSQWVFDPPLRNKLPASVRVKVPFHFKAPKD